MFTILDRQYSFSEIQFKNAVQNNFSIAGTLRELNLVVGGANYRKVSRLIKSLKLDNSHWTGQGHLKGKKHNWAPIRPLNDILVENSDYTCLNLLKKRLLKEGLLVYKCYNPECSITTNWLDKPISLHLEHKNGNQDDHRLENLCLLCPNCHSQTPTYCRKKSSLKLVG